MCATFQLKYTRTICTHEPVPNQASSISDDRKVAMNTSKYPSDVSTSVVATLVGLAVGDGQTSSGKVAQPYAWG